MTFLRAAAAGAAYSSVAHWRETGHVYTVLDREEEDAGGGSTARRRVLIVYFSRPGENYYYGGRTELKIGNTDGPRDDDQEARRRRRVPHPRR